MADARDRPAGSRWVLALALVGCSAPAPPDGPPLADFTLRDADGEVVGEAAVIGRGAARLGERLRIRDADGRTALSVDGEVTLADAALAGARLHVVRGRRARDVAVAAGPPARWSERAGLALHEREVALDGPLRAVSEALDPTGATVASLALWYALAPTLPRVPGGAARWTALNLPDGRTVEVEAEVRAQVEVAGRTAARLFVRTPATGHTVWVDADSGELLAVDDVFGLAAARTGWRPPPRPRPPLPPGVEEVEVAVDTPEVALRGTLALPAPAARPAPLLLLVHGSGPMDRDESPFMVFRALSDAAAAAGWAVLRYDKRGVGESELHGRPAPTLAAYTADAAAWLTALAGRPDLRACRVVLGHSEGGMIAPQLVGARDDIDGVVLLAAPVEPLPIVLAHQLERVLHAHGLDEPTIERARSAQQALFRRAARFDRGRAGGDDDTRDALTWLRSHAEHRPEPALAAVRSPILGLYGASDLQVPVDQAEKLAALASGARLALTLAVFPGLDHVLMPDRGRPGLGLLADPDRTLDPAVPARLSSWLSSLPCARSSPAAAE